MNKTKSIFDFINCLFQHKIPWEDLSESDKKNFNPYMINRLISMHPDYITTVNYLQQYTVDGMSPREVYKLYFDILPKTKFWSKYIKSSTNKDEKINESLINFIATQEHWSKDETYENLLYIFNLGNDGINLLFNYLEMFGISKKDAVNIYKLKT